MARYVLLARLYLDSGTEYLSDTTVTHPTRTYDGRVLDWGLIDRSIPVPAGLPQVSDSRIRVADPDRKWRDLLATQTARRRFLDIKLVQTGTSESAANTIFRGEIVDHSFGPAYAEFTIRNRAFAWLDEDIPNLIHKGNYSYIVRTDSAFLNIINGHNESPTENPTGVIPCPHIGFHSVAGDRYGVAAHPVEEVVTVYRKEPGDDDFAVVNIAEYNIGTEADREFLEFPGIPFNPTYIDFIVEQPPGTQIRADVDGINYRGPWEGIPEAATFEENRNPINFFINMMYLVMHKAGTTGDDWDVDSIEDLLDVFENFIPDSASSSGFKRFNCDGAITEAMKVREWLGRFLTSTQIQLFEKTNGKLALGYIGDTDPTRPVFKEGYHFLKDSFFEQAARPTVNQSRYHFAANYTNHQFNENEIFNNDADQVVLGKPVLDSSGSPVLDSNGDPVIQPHIESDDVQFWWIRDPITALYSVGRRMNFLALGSMRQEWKMPLPEVLNDIELCKLVGITHAMGAQQTTGYVNKEVAITGITIHPQNLMVTIRSILRVPVDINPARLLTACLPMDLLEGEIEPDDIDTRWDGTQQAIALEDIDGAVDAYFEASFQRDFDVDDHTFQLVDGSGNVEGALTFPPAPPSEIEYRSRMEVSIDVPVQSKTFYLKTLATATPGCHFEQARFWICVEDSVRAAIQIPLIFGAQQIGGFSGTEQDNNRNFSACESRNSATYAQEAAFESNYGIFLFERDKWGDILAIRLKSIAYNKNYNPGEFGRVALFNRTDNLMITGSEQEWTHDDDDPEVRSATFSPSLFEDGKEYEIRSLNSPATSLRKLMMNRSDLWVVVAGNTAPAQVYIKLASHSWNAIGNQRTKLETYPAGSVIKFEAVATRSAGTAWVQLLDAGTSDVGDTGSLVHQLDFTGTAKQRHRATVTLTPGNRYLINIQNVFFTSAFLIVEVP